MASREQDLIQRHFEPLARAAPGAFGLRDDAALLEADPGADIVATNDALIAGIHFLAGDAPDLIARKALRVNLSDLAAKGAEPLSYLLVIALPRDLADDWIGAFAQGLTRDQEEYGCVLIGGDTVSTPGPLTISITAFGAVPKGKMVHRQTAREGAAIYVTGTIGDAALGLKLLTGACEAGKLDDDRRSTLVERYHLPRPRTDAIGLLRAHASAAMDISDGLVGDLELMCAASGTSAEIAADAVPLSDAARLLIGSDRGLLETALTGGDDYELLVCILPEAAARFEADAAQSGVAVTRIGAMTAAGPGVIVRDGEGRALTFESSSFSHL